MEAHVKSINTDKRSKKRIRFASAKERSKRASADVYRSYKRKIGVTSAATREELVHNPSGAERKKKRSRKSHRAIDGDSRTAVVKVSKDNDNDDDNKSDSESDGELELSSTFAMELDVAIDRNASEIFSKFHRQIWGLVRSLPEILHHSEKIVDLMMSYMLSPAEKPERPSDLSSQDRKQENFILNHATTDILHLISVLARDLRHEIHEYLHQKILPRIIQDLLNPPPPPPNSGKQPIPLDVTIVEAAFRTLSYIFRYDSKILEHEFEDMRKYYGVTLANRRELVRRLAAETFAPMIRRLKNVKSTQRHLRRVLRALSATEGQPVTSSLKRTQGDGVDGISKLFFQLVKGAPGKMHSRGHHIVCFLLSYCGQPKGDGTAHSNKSLGFAVVSAFLDLLFHHISDESSELLLVEIVGNLNAALQAFKASTTKGNDKVPSFEPIYCMVEFLEKIALKRSGNLVCSQDDQEVERLVSVLESMFTKGCFSSMPNEEKGQILSRCCSIWISIQDKTFFPKRMKQILEQVFQLDKDASLQQIESMRSMSEIVSEQLLSKLTNTSTCSAAGMAIVVGASRLSEHDDESALLLVLPIASLRLETTEEDQEASVDQTACLFHPKAGNDWELDPSVKNNLLRHCYKKPKAGADFTLKHLTQLGVALRCAPFLVLISANFESPDEIKGHYKKISKWAFSVLQLLDETTPDLIKGASARDLVIVQALALEAVAYFASEAASIGDSSMAEKFLSKARGYAERLVFSDTKSVWALRGAASALRLLRRFEISFDYSPDKVFEAMIPNLSSPNHCLRMYSLEILNCLPKKAFVTDYADLDLQGDLDEEVEHPRSDQTSARSGPTGICDLIESMLKLEQLPVSLPNERVLLSLASRVETLGRTGKLPVVYAEAAANHMLGLFHVKFSPLWDAACRSLLALVEAHEKVVWPYLEAELVAVMKPSPILSTDDDSVTEAQSLSSTLLHHAACVKWQESSGKDVSVFLSATAPEKEGEVPHHHTTDTITVMESVWKVAEEGHQFFVKNSRVLIPIFISFLHNEYFVYYSTDPEKRELHLQDFAAEDNSFDRGLIDRQYLQRRLKCFFQVFAVVDGPQQMVQHELLQNIFRSFLSHQDPAIAELALSSFMKFKQRFLISNGDGLKAMLQKGGLRNAMLKLGEDVETGKIADEHRKLLIPVLTRMLFGRLTAKGAKSSKDSPATRRAAVLSFLSSLCKSDTDLFPIVYWMTRGFIPKNEALRNVESYDETDRQRILNLLLSIEADGLSQVQSNVIEGFLHLLSTAVSQLGHRLGSFVPQLASIVVGLCGFAAVRRDNRSVHDDKESPEDDGDNGQAVASEEDPVGDKNSRLSTIRTLCYNRLSELFLRFGGFKDFEFLLKPLWHALETSIKLLPEMVVKSDKSPALLSLLETMSTEPQLIDLLDVAVDPVHAVIKCIAVTSQTAVVNSSLTFIENLLTIERDESGPAGSHLVQKHLPLLLEQFSLRLQGGTSSESTGPNSSASSNARAQVQRGPTWRRELSILCRVSEMIDDCESSRLQSEAGVLERLCSLLLSFLEPGRPIQDDDKMKVVSILKGVVPQINPTAAAAVFRQLSKTLPPSNAKIGITSLQVRSGIASLFASVGNVNKDFKDVACTLTKLCAVHPRRVDEIGFDVVIPVLNDLYAASDDCAWISLGGEESFDRTLLPPIINVCFHFLHNDDGVISRAAFNALKSLVAVASSRSASRREKAQDLEDSDEWAKLMETSIIPLAKAGLHARDVSIRRYYVLLIREVAKFFDGQSSPHLLGDLGVLYNDENPDLDFFVNITHVQIHRRARGLQRLRKVFNDSNMEGSICPIGAQSLSNVVLPLAMHPVFECTTKTEETYALEAIATIGAISRFLTWKKYHSTLWTVLTQFDRNASRERYMVGLLCAIIDGFRFELVSNPEKESSNAGDDDNAKTAVWRALENRVLPKIEGLLTKEKVDKHGTRIKTIRAPILLALLKLFQRFPGSFFESRLPRLLAVICDALASRDSDVRDTARTTLGKMVVSMDLKYLADVIREVSITLHEGYKLHVRAATIHTILQVLSSVYTQPSSDSGETLWLDKCVPAFMNVIQDDLFGVANERRESRDTNVRYVKEAGGTKSVNSVEIICKLIRFQPSAANEKSLSESSVHCVVSPLLERLRLPEVDSATIRKIREILARVVIGLSHNPTVDPVELLPFVFATVQPFIGVETVSSLLEKPGMDEDEDEDDDEDHASSIRISGSTVAKANKKTRPKSAVVEWRPSTLGTSTSARDATDRKMESSKELRKVTDGASAPKLTGSGRHGAVLTRALDSPASASAVVFGLNLLNSCLKTVTFDQGGDLPGMMDPFVPLLTACVCHCRDVDVLVVTFKCIVAMLRFKLPSFSTYSKLLGSKTLDFLASGGSSLNQNQDLIQACFKTLAYLINTKSDSRQSSDEQYKPVEGEDALSANIAMPLTSDQMKVLISILQVSLAESEQHNPALALIKAIMSRKFVSPEFYDLMDSMLKLVVRSQKPSLRQQSAGIFIRFLLDFPMAEGKFGQHLKQVVANISYEHQEGRMSAINLLVSLIEKMPEELLNTHAQLIFLPLVLQKVNDDSKPCREGVTKCLVVLLTRCSTEVQRSCHDYCVRWSKSQGPLLVASLQIFGIFVESCTDFMKKKNFVPNWVERLEGTLQSPQSDWEVVYFSLISVEKLSENFQSYVGKQDELYIQVVERMIDSHPWIKLATSRILKNFLGSREAGTFFKNNLGILFQIVRNLCFQLGADEKEQNEELSDLDIKILTVLIPTIHTEKHLCFSEEDKEKEETGNPVLWLMRRLSQIAKAKGKMRRMAVFKCFAAFTTKHTQIVAPHMEVMLEPLHRSSTEASNEVEVEVESSSMMMDGTGDEKTEVVISTESSLARDVIHLIEEAAADPTDFLKAYAAVKTRAQEKKDERKSEAKAEAIRDPKAFAEKKIKKHEREKQRKKRRVDERRRDRGGRAKRRHVS